MNSRTINAISACLFLIFLAALMLLILNKETEILRYTVFLGAFIFSGRLVYYVRFSSRLSSGHRATELNKNISEAQKLLNEKKNLFRKHLSSKAPQEYFSPVQFNNQSFEEIIQSPITWLTCVGVGAMLMFHPAYLEIHEQIPISNRLIAKIFALSSLQLLLFGILFSGMLLKIMSALEGRKT